MTHATRTGPIGTRTGLVVTGIALLLALAVGPVWAGSASATPLPATNPSPTTQWAYGGQGNSSGTFQIDGTTLTWDASFGWTVIFTATNTSHSTVRLEEQRAVGIDVTTTLTSSNLSAKYTFHGTESDTAFVNLTKTAKVYVNGTAVRALGIENESLLVHATVDQSLRLSAHGHSARGWLNVSGVARGSVAFSPALGLVPLNLSGITMWNSSATASPAASWNISYAYADVGWNGTTRSGSVVSTGNWSANGPVSLIGFKVALDHPFSDHQPRVAILLLVTGPVDVFDGYLLIPHDFDLFGSAAHPFDAESLGSASVGTGLGETLYLSQGPDGPFVTAADSTFGASGGTLTALGEPSAGPAPAASSPTSTTVQGQPMSVAAAQAESDCLTMGCGSSSSAISNSLFGLGWVALAVLAAVGTVATIEWRAHARRRNTNPPVDGCGERRATGLPPPGAVRGHPLSTDTTLGPDEGPIRP